MIFFSGWGVLLLPAFFAVGVAVMFGLQPVVGDANRAIAAAAGGLAAATACWWGGTKLNGPSKDRIVANQKTGKTLTVRSRHTLMFVPIQYYAVAFLAFFGFLAIS